MKILKNIFLFFILSGIGISSCKKDKPVDESINFGYNYFPDDVGRYVIYEVDSIWQDDPEDIHDTARYLVMEKISEHFTDNSGRPTLRIERYFKYYNPAVSYDSMNWSVPRIWTANKTNTTLERKEENITYIKLIFPVREGKHWNGNTYNTLGDKEYEIVSADVPMTINNLYFDSVATVDQYLDSNLVFYEVEKEKYARNVGLIYKKFDKLSFQQHDQFDNIPFDDTVGYRYVQKIISYGK